MDKDGAVTAVDEGLFHIGVHWPKKKKMPRGTCRHQKQRIKGWQCMSYHGNFLVQEDLRDNSLGKGKATKLY